MPHILKTDPITGKETEVYEDTVMDHCDGIPTIFLPERPGIPTAYFGGPWLPMSYTNECVEYFYSIEYPLQILEMPERRKRIVEALDELGGARQGMLFSECNGTLDSSLEDLLRLEGAGKKLYQRWKKEVNGKNRSLSVPAEPLKRFLAEYIVDIVKRAPVHPQCHGGEKGWSVEASLRSHMPFARALSFDIESAFMSVHIQYVFDLFYSFLAGKMQDETRKDVAGFLTSVCTVNYGSCAALPQGSPISIVLFNRIMQPVDDVYYRSAKKRGFYYTRWVDDMIISSKKNAKPGKFFGALSLMRRDFPIKAEKVFFQTGPQFYLMGHVIEGNNIRALAEGEEAKRGEPVNPLCYATELERDHATLGDDYVDAWTEDYGEFDDTPKDPGEARPDIMLGRRPDRLDESDIPY